MKLHLPIHFMGYLVLFLKMDKVKFNLLYYFIRRVNQSLEKRDTPLRNHVFWVEPCHWQGQAIGNVFGEDNQRLPL
jgi:hypothetical protein